MILIFYCIMQSHSRFRATKSLLSRLITRVSGVLPALLFSIRQNLGEGSRSGAVVKGIYVRVWRA